MFIDQFPQHQAQTLKFFYSLIWYENTIPIIETRIYMMHGMITSQSLYNIILWIQGFWRPSAWQSKNCEFNTVILAYRLFLLHKIVFLELIFYFMYIWIAGTSRSWYSCKGCYSLGCMYFRLVIDSYLYICSVIIQHCIMPLEQLEDIGYNGQNY